ncbi:MAG: 50S ribosomal protein L25 [Armatimonadetes bacterium]|nr:50S ribosomal protein L25 [Armatimonadota bacterium]
MRSEQVEIPVNVRTEVGKIAAKRIRGRGHIPAVVYGKGVEPIPVTVDEAMFARAVSPAAWYSTLINLKIEGDNGPDTATVMIRELQRDLVKQQVVSIDFRRVSLKETIQTHVSVRHVGESPGVKAGGIIDQVTHEVLIECLPTDIPEHLEVNISELEIGDSVRVKNLADVPDGVKVLTPEDDAVIVIAPPLREEELEPEIPEDGALVEEMAEPELVGEGEEEQATEESSE